jgi:hypothetical protein
MFHSLRKNYPNLYVLITGIGILCWFKGMYGIMDHFIPQKLNWSIAVAVTGIAILYLNDFNLSEIHDAGHAGPAMGAARRGVYGPMAPDLPSPLVAPATTT